MDFEPVLPLKTFVFQLMFGGIAVAIEAGILRQRLKLGFQQSVQYTTVVNLAAVVVGWFTFLAVEPLVKASIREQIISYIFFDQIMLNGWTAQFGAILFAMGLTAFFVTLIIKAKGLEFLMRADDRWAPLQIPKEATVKLARDERYARARGGMSDGKQAISSFTDAVIYANAASFSAILGLIVLRAVITRGGL